MASWFRARSIHPGVATAFAGLVILFIVVLCQFYIPGKGMSYLISFGGLQESSRLSKLRKVDHHILQLSGGYDAQYYVQIAMDPSLRNTQLRNAVDSLAYRGRRILTPAVAYLTGLGQPDWIVQAYAVQNGICWLVLAAVLLHWFPPRNWNNFFRWAGVLFSFGLCVSVRYSLIDGPSLLLIAVGVLLLEKKRGWSATAVLALAGLAKETNLLAAAGLAPDLPADRRSAWRSALRLMLVAAPLVLWLIYLTRTVGSVADAGQRNFHLPFVGYVHKWHEVLDSFSDLSMGNLGPLWGLLMLISLTVQFLFLVLRPDWNRAWWRIGMSYALLMVFLGDAVWEGFPGASSRVLLPMQLAFNVMVPAGPWWAAVLLLGNLTFFNAYSVLQSPPGDGYELNGNSALLYADDGRFVEVHYLSGWHLIEKSPTDFWCWSSGTAALALYNPQSYPMLMRLRFNLSVAGERSVQLRLNGREIWQVRQAEANVVTVTLSSLEFLPGENRIDLVTDVPPQVVGNDPRLLAFKLHNLRIDLKRKQP